MFHKARSNKLTDYDNISGKANGYGVLISFHIYNRCLWFMLEVLMTKNENNSHAFLRKMVENIKQTKDAQCPEDVKANEVTFSELKNTHLYNCLLHNVGMSTHS